MPSTVLRNMRHSPDVVRVEAWNWHWHFCKTIHACKTVFYQSTVFRYRLKTLLLNYIEFYGDQKIVDHLHYINVLYVKRNLQKSQSSQCSKWPTELISISWWFVIDIVVILQNVIFAFVSSTMLSTFSRRNTQTSYINPKRQPAPLVLRIGNEGRPSET